MLGVEILTCDYSNEIPSAVISQALLDLFSGFYKTKVGRQCS